MAILPTITPEEERFLVEHRFGVVTTLRKDGSPQSTPVYYVFEKGKLWISVTQDRKKTYNVLRDPRVTMCALAEQSPFDYVQVMGTAEITDNDLEATSWRIWSRFRDPMPDDFPQRLVDQKRMLLVITPENVTSRLTRV
jgi:PPOX class probable F420-dependent enzyme